MPDLQPAPRRLPPDLGYPLALLAFAALVLRPLLRGETFLGGDVVTFNLPQFQRISELWHAGRLPGWAPELGLGRPMLADLSLMLHYPGNAVVWLLPPLEALNAFVAGHYAWWVLGTYALARHMRLSPGGAFATAAAHCLGGLGVSSLGSAPLLAGLSWVPWCALGFSVAANGPWRWGSTALAACPFALACLTSAVDYTAGAGVCAAFCALARGAPLRRVALQLTATALLAVSLAGAALVPAALELTQLARGAGLPWDVAAHWSLHPLELPGALIPQAFWPNGAGLPAAWIGLEEGRPWFVSLYVGLVAPALLAVGIRDHDLRRRRWLLGLAGGALVYAFGRYTPVFGLCWELLPPVRAFRYPAKQLVPAALALALLVGVGWDRWRRSPRTLITPLLAGVGLVVLGVLLAVGQGSATMVDRAAHVLLAAGLGVALALRRGPARALLLVLAADLVLAAPLASWTAPNRLLEEPATFVDPILAEQRQLGVPARVTTLEGCDGIRLRLPGLELGPAAAQALTRREILAPNSASQLGVRTTWAFSSIDPARRIRYEVARRSAGLSPLEQARRLGARWVVHTAGQVEPGGEVARSGPWSLSRVPRALPWATVCTQAVSVAGFEQALALALAPEHDPAQACVLEGGAPSRAAEPAKSARVVLEGAERDRLQLRVESSAPGVVVIREAWAPGWEATVNGARAPVWPADGLFRGVPVPAGRSELVLSYRAAGREAGQALTVVGLLAVLAGLAAGWRRASTPE